MRTERLQLSAASFALVWLVLTANAALCADAPRIAVEIRAQDTLTRGAHVGVAVVVTIDAEVQAPLLLTPHIEGSAVELVRGRLMRSDAQVLDANHLLFEVPVVARSEGTAILRVEIATYECRPRCTRVTQSETRVLHVR